jgi:hypothetical protein
MKVFNLQCDTGHRFEGWFASVEACDDQQRKGLLECPVCESQSVRRMPTAARLSMGSGLVEQAKEAGQPAPVAMKGATSALSPDQIALRNKIIAMAQSLAEKADYVGRDFPEQARRMHYQEAPERSIVGEATPQEASALLEEGISVVPLPLAVIPKKDRLQ